MRQDQAQALIGKTVYRVLAGHVFELIVMGIEQKGPTYRTWWVIVLGDGSEHSDTQPPLFFERIAALRYAKDRLENSIRMANHEITEITEQRDEDRKHLLDIDRELTRAEIEAQIAAK